MRQGLEKKEFTITDCPVRGACFVMCDLLAGDMSLLEDLVKHMPHEEQEAVAWLKRKADEEATKGRYKLKWHLVGACFECGSLGHYADGHKNQEQTETDRKKIEKMRWADDFFGDYCMEIKKKQEESRLVSRTVTKPLGSQEKKTKNSTEKTKKEERAEERAAKRCKHVWNVWTLYCKKPGCMARAPRCEDEAHEPRGAPFFSCGKCGRKNKKCTEVEDPETGKFGTCIYSDPARERQCQLCGKWRKQFGNEKRAPLKEKAAAATGAEKTKLQKKIKKLQRGKNTVKARKKENKEEPQAKRLRDRDQSKAGKKKKKNSATAK